MTYTVKKKTYCVSVPLKKMRRFRPNRKICVHLGDTASTMTLKQSQRSCKKNVYNHLLDPKCVLKVVHMVGATRVFGWTILPYKTDLDTKGPFAFLVSGY